MMNCDRGFLDNFRVWTVPRVSVEDPRGARHRGASSCHTLVYGRTAWILDHDAVMRICGEAPGGGPILSVGIKCHVRIRGPATSDRQFGSPDRDSGTSERADPAVALTWCCAVRSEERR